MNKPFIHLHPASAAKARFTAAEFLSMGMVGAFDGMKVELVGGELERMSPPMCEHGRLQGDVNFFLRQALASAEFRVLGETGISIGEDTVRNGDVVVVSPASRPNRLLMPEEVFLVVEIAVTTLDRDMGAKRIDYARAGIAHYWVVDGERRVVHVFAGPVSGDYTDVRTVKFGAPLEVPGTGSAITLD